ncbi:MAG: 30S ribosomal protein S9 [Planctomycetes bacterium]|nr:30S ribosomal protein S9 [Planctomycetota bacterium]
MAEDPIATAVPKETKEYLWTTGRRKTSVARVRLAKGTGTITINRRPIEKYFLTEQERAEALEPLYATKSQGKFDLLILCDGGGMAGQAGAVRLGIARALKQVDPTLEPKLRADGLLTRDPRMKERKKYGLRGARRGVQYSKR